jgi:cytidylate kinase
MGTYGGAKELAQNLSEKMGYSCLCREDLVEAATRDGIQVGKLEMSTIKPRAFTERLARERDHYLAFSRAFLCEKALEGDLVYYGRTGHLLLPGVRHVLKVRVVLDLEHRIQGIVDQMGLDREKALRYVNDVDQDRSRWARSMYGIAVEEAINYDITVNLQQMSVGNAAAALVTTVQLPEFQMTPASEKALRDLHVGAKARLALARDSRTHSASLTVRADDGVVTVGYRPQDLSVAESIERVLESVEGIRDLQITMATANLLWIQERFSPDVPDFENVIQIATKWNAAVELLRLAPEEEKPAGIPQADLQGKFPADSIPGGSGEEASQDDLEAVASTPFNGGVEADEDEIESESQAGGLQETLDGLAQVGRSGGGRTVFGDRQRLIESLDRTTPYTLVVLGDLFLSKGHAAKQRAVRDLRGFLEDRIRAPIVTADELGPQYLFGRRDILRAGLFLAVTVLILVFVFQNQESVLAFMANTGWYAQATADSALGTVSWLPKLVVAMVVFLLIPVFAYSYGRVASAFLKFIKME